jgi:hypothetical protein
MMSSGNGDSRKKYSGTDIVTYLTEDLDYEVIRLDPPEIFDKAIVGFHDDWGDGARLIYSYDKLLEATAELLGPDWVTDKERDMAVTEYLEFNTIRALAYMGRPPIILRTPMSGFNF